MSYTPQRKPEITQPLRRLEVFTVLLHYISCLFLFLFQVDANAISVDYSKIALNINYAQAASDIRVTARYVTK